MRIKIANVLPLSLMCVMLAATMCSAQTRTTPVEVENTPTVQSQQSGTWSVGITGTPNVSITNIPNINIANTPSVSVTNSPTVNVGNSPTVKIDSTTNTVSAPTLTKGVKLWATDPTFSGSSNSVYCDCGGYREARIVIKVSSTLTNPENLKVFIEYENTPSGGSFTPGYVTFATPTSPMVQGGTFAQSSGICMFVAPVLTTRMWFYVMNSTGSPVTIDSARSWAWFVN